MPIQEILTGVTFPGSGLVNVNTLKNPLQYFGSLLHLWSKADSGVTLSPGLSVPVTASSITGNVGTITVNTNGNVNLAYALDQQITVANCTNATACNGTFPISAMGTTTLSFAVTAANVSSAAESSATVVAQQVSNWSDNSSYIHPWNVIGDINWPGPAEGSYTSPINTGITLPSLVSTGVNGHRGFLRQTYSSDFDFPATSPFSIILAVIPGTSGGAGDVYPCTIGTVLGSAAGPPGGWSLSPFQTASVKQPTFRLINTKGTAEASISMSSAITSGTPCTLYAINSGAGNASGLSMYMNGISQATTTLFNTLGTATTVSGVAVGILGDASTGGGVSTDTVLEVIIVAKALTTTDIAFMDAYLNEKWGIHS